MLDSRYIARSRFHHAETEKKAKNAIEAVTMYG